MTMLFRASHRLYKRHQASVESVIIATGLTFLLAVFLISLDVYPPNWTPVLIALVWLLALRWSWSAYMVATLAVLYPLYTISIYIAILFIAVTTLAHRPLSYYLGASVLILAVPLLGAYHLHWAVPILMGLWWGSTNGIWMGAAAAVWGQLATSMAGMNGDLLLIAGQTPEIAGFIQRFSNLGALETLSKVIAPFTQNATVLLYHLLQVTLWGGVAGLTGGFSSQQWIYRYYPWSGLVTVSLGVVALGVGHITLATWLYEVGVVIDNQVLILTALTALFVCSSFEVVRQYLELPILPQQRAKSKTRLWQGHPQKAQSPDFAQMSTSASMPTHQSIQASGSSSSSRIRQSSEPREKPSVVPLPDLPEWKPPKEDSGLILLELD